MVKNVWLLKKIFLLYRFLARGQPANNRTCTHHPCPLPKLHRQRRTDDKRRNQCGKHRDKIRCARQYRHIPARNTDVPNRIAQTHARRGGQGIADGLRIKIQTVCSADKIFRPQKQRHQHKEKAHAASFRLHARRQRAICRPKKCIGQCHQITGRIGADIVINPRKRQSAVAAQYRGNPEKRQYKAYAYPPFCRLPVETDCA